MSLAEVYLKFKAWLEDKVSAGFRNLVTVVQKGCQSAGKALAGLSAMFGELPGKCGQVVSGMANMVNAFMSMGGIFHPRASTAGAARRIISSSRASKE